MLQLRRTTRRDPADDLRALAYFTNMTRRELRFAAQHADWTIVTAGTRLQRRGHTIGWIWVAVDDPLEQRLFGDLLETVEPGAACLETSLLLGSVSPVDVIAPVDTQVVSLPARAFHGLLGYADFAADVARRQAGLRMALAPRVIPKIAFA